MSTITRRSWKRQTGASRFFVIFTIYNGTHSQADADLDHDSSSELSLFDYLYKRCRPRRCGRFNADGTAWTRPEACSTRRSAAGSVEFLCHLSRSELLDDPVSQQIDFDPLAFRHWPRVCCARRRRWSLDCVISTQLRFCKLLQGCLPPTPSELRVHTAVAHNKQKAHSHQSKTWQPNTQNTPHTHHGWHVELRELRRRWVRENVAEPARMLSLILRRGSDQRHTSD